ncbi:methylenetetrahydrofolate reductase (NADPH) [Phymastichus coffea]|uniref:methylenetetrahydrofolate reductase (NADPH) n=1 Tax=Phymastichus coffea TaxID=108790 RepID=UPI00273CAC08|nr:methylenetetrahydrofolate reductase (NADPH) [Phymastichus coffea]
MRHRVLDGEAVDPSEFHEEAVLDRGKPVNLAWLIDEKQRQGEHFCSYELFPSAAPGTYQRFFKETEHCAPLFYSLTWPVDASAKWTERFPSLKIAEENMPCNTLLHCAARGLSCNQVEEVLNRALELGIVNVFALEGDGQTYGGHFEHALDLVRFIRQRFAQQFSICVAGYPETHPRSASKEQDLLHLKEKIDAGADFIITQFFFESSMYIQFVKDCRELGISVPIIPGIFPFTNIKSLEKMASLSRAQIPPWMQEQLESLRDNDEAVRRFGIDLSLKIIKDIWKSNICFGYHIFTLNRSFSAVEIYRQLKANETMD